jgi:hypothetical protein
MKTRKLHLLLFVLALMTGIFALLKVFESRRIPGWRAELQRYLRLSGSSIGEVRIIAAVEAASPQNFSSDLLIAVPTGSTWQDIIEIPSPVVVECVRLEGPFPHQGYLEWQVYLEVVLIGYHDDGLWHSGWLVHEVYGVVSKQVLQDMLARLGCDLGLDNLQAGMGIKSFQAI